MSPEKGTASLRLSNRNFSLKTTLKIIDEIWASHDPTIDDINVGITAPFIVDADLTASQVTIKAYFDQRGAGNDAEILELAYNFADALDRFRWIYACQMLREVVRGRLHWRCGVLADEAEESLLSAMIQVDRRIRGKLSNKVPKGNANSFPVSTIRRLRYTTLRTFQRFMRYLMSF